MSKKTTQPHLDRLLRITASGGSLIAGLGDLAHGELEMLRAELTAARETIAEKDKRIAELEQGPAFEEILMRNQALRADLAEAVRLLRQIESSKVFYVYEPIWDALNEFLAKHGGK